MSRRSWARPSTDDAPPRSRALLGLVTSPTRRLGRIHVAGRPLLGSLRVPRQHPGPDPGERYKIDPQFVLRAVEPIA